jgi:hypothetical protein
MRKIALAVGLAVMTVVGSLAWGAAPAAADAGVEGEFVSLTNGERSSALTVHAELTSIARRWSAKMAADNRLAHNPNLANEVTADWEKLGENVGTGDNARQIHDAFMNSPAHRANIVDPAFTYVGIGVVRGGDGRIWVTEVFMRLRGGGGGSAPAPTTTAAPSPPTTARPRVTTPPTTAAPRPAPTTTAAPPTTEAPPPPPTTTTTTTVPLPPPPPDGSTTTLRPRYALVLDGLARLDEGHE